MSLTLSWNRRPSTTAQRIVDAANMFSDHSLPRPATKSALKPYGAADNEALIEPYDPIDLKLKMELHSAESTVLSNASTRLDDSETHSMNGDDYRNPGAWTQQHNVRQSGGQMNPPDAETFDTVLQYYYLNDCAAIVRQLNMFKSDEQRLQAFFGILQNMTYFGLVDEVQLLHALAEWSCPYKESILQSDKWNPTNVPSTFLTCWLTNERCQLTIKELDRLRAILAWTHGTNPSSAETLFQLIRFEEIQRERLLKSLAQFASKTEPHHLVSDHIMTLVIRLANERYQLAETTLSKEGDRKPSKLWKCLQRLHLHK